jgi:predicted Ser/Thr protein kinase
MATQTCYYCNALTALADASCPSCNRPLLLYRRYRLVRLLGRGGFGVVYEALDERLNRRCAIKAVVATSLAEQRQIEAEAGILSQDATDLDFIPHIYDMWSESGQTFLVMEYIDGPTLDQTPLPWAAAQVEHVLRALLGNLAQLHDTGIIHRDLKPENIKRTPQGRYVILDFGIAKRNSATMTAARALSLDYAPPEQMQGCPTDARSDLYSLAATAYHLLMGHPPSNVGLRMSNEASGSAVRIPPGIPSALATTLTRMLELDPAARPADAQAALALLNGTIEPTVALSQNPGAEHATARSSVGAPTEVIARLRVPDRHARTDHAGKARRDMVPERRRFSALIGGTLLLMGVLVIGAAFVIAAQRRAAALVVPTSVTAATVPSQPVASPQTGSATSANEAPVTALPSGSANEIPISIASYGGDNIRDSLPGFPVGEQQFGGVRFLIPETHNAIQTYSAKRPNLPASFTIPLPPTADADSVYILINSGHSYAKAKNKVIGRIGLHFGDRRTFSYDLILGQNIREWRFQVPGVIGTSKSPDLLEVYRGRSTEGDIGAIDMLKLKIPDKYRDGALDSITFEDLFNENAQPTDTCLEVVGLTVGTRSTTAPGARNMQMYP